MWGTVDGSYHCISVWTLCGQCVCGDQPPHTLLLVVFRVVVQLKERISELEQDRDLLKENNEKLVNR